MGINATEKLWETFKDIRHKGGSFTVEITKRGAIRTIVIRKFPENYIRCDDETIVFDD